MRHRLPRAERAQQLLDVAEEVFVTQGLQASSMEDIAERAGVTKPVVYDHFGSKDGLLAAVIDRAAGQLQALTARAVAEGDGEAEDAMARGLRCYFAFLSSRAGAWQAVLTETTGTASAAAHALERARQAQVDYIAPLILAQAPQVGEEAARIYAEVVVGAAERLGLRCGVLSPDELAAHAMDVLWLGFDRLRSGHRWRSPVALKK